MRAVYETIIIIDGRILEETYKHACTHYRSTIREIGGRVKSHRKLGARMLAYPIESEGCSLTSGWYAQYIWEGTPDQVRELERLLRIDSLAVKFITVKTDDPADFVDTPEEDDERVIIPPIDNAGAASVESEQPDALDVMLGLAKYKTKGELI